MSAHVEPDESERLARFRRSVLAGYYYLRSSLWRSVVLLGIVLSVIAFVLDTFGIHEIFAGMFGVWGMSAVVAGILGYVVISLIRTYARLTKRAG